MTRTNDYGQPVGDAVTWNGASTPAPRTLAGRWVRLRPMTVDDATSVMEVLTPHPELFTYQAEEAPADEGEAVAVIEALLARPDTLPFAILDARSGAFVGRACYLRVQPQVGSIEVGSIIYAPALQRTTGATETQVLLMAHAFDDLGYRRYEWKCDSLNAASCRAAVRLGFVEEGTWRRALVTKGRNRDTTWFSVTSDEWLGVKAAFDAWLADDNLDAAGLQRRSLEQVRAATQA